MSERIRCYTTGDEIKNLNEMTDDDKPEFQEISEADLMYMFQDQIFIKDDIILEEEEIMELPNNLTFDVYGPDWYKMKFPGFDDEHYAIMAASAKLENEMINLE
jgi:hypothetical protein